MKKSQINFIKSYFGGTINQLTLQVSPTDDPNMYEAMNPLARDVSDSLGHKITHFIPKESLELLKGWLNVEILEYGQKARIRRRAFLTTTTKGNVQ